MRCFVRSPAATWRRLPGKVVLALPGWEAPLQLNSTGALVWDLLAEVRSEADIGATLATACETPPDLVAAAVTQLLDDLLVREVVLEVVA